MTPELKQKLVSFVENNPVQVLGALLYYYDGYFESDELDEIPEIAEFIDSLDTPPVFDNDGGVINY